MQGTQHTGGRIQIPRVFGKLLEGILRCLKQDSGHFLAVVAPDRVQLRGQRKNDMMMGAIQQHALRIEQPLLRGFGPALWTVPMLTRVIPDSVQVAVLTILGVPAQGGGSTG